MRYACVFLVLLVSALLLECTNTEILQKPITVSDRTDGNDDQITNEDLIELIQSLEEFDSLIEYQDVELSENELLYLDSLDSIFNVKTAFLLAYNDSLLEEAQIAILFYQSTDDTLLLEQYTQKVEKISFDIRVTKEFQQRKERLPVISKNVGIGGGHLPDTTHDSSWPIEPPSLFPSSSNNIGVSSSEFRDFNRAPDLAHGDSIQKIIMEDAGVHSMTLIAHDIEGDMLYWSVNVDSTIFKIDTKENDSSMVVEYFVSNNVSGEFAFKVYVSDGNKQDSIKIIVKVLAVNDAPQYGDFSVVSGDPLTSRVLSVVAGGVCTDTLDDESSMTLPFTYQWFYTENDAGNEGRLIGDGDSLTIGDSLVGGYIYSVVSCMDDSSAVAFDRSALVGPIEDGVKAGDVLSFDAAHKQYVELPDYEIEYNKGFTIEAIVKWDVVGEGARIIEIGNDSVNNVSAENIVLKVEKPNRLVFLHSDSPGSWSTIYADGVIQTGEWIHVAVTVNGEGVARLYRNGQLQEVNGGGITEFQLKPIINHRRTSNYIGKSTWDKENSYFDGRIDEIRIWQIRRSSAQIQNNWSKDFVDFEETDGIYAVYDFNQESGSALIDIVEGKDGQLINYVSPQWGLKLP